MKICLALTILISSNLFAQDQLRYIRNPEAEAVQENDLPPADQIEESHPEQNSEDVRDNQTEDDYNSEPELALNGYNF